MGILEKFIKTGSIGPIVLGISPFEAMQLLGEPDQESQKKNPLTIKYGTLQLVFWKHASQGKSLLREIDLAFDGDLKCLPSLIALDDFTPSGPPSEKYFRNFMHEHRCMPVHMVESDSRRQLIFLSGVVATFSDGMLERIRINQREKKETAPAPLSDEREPSRQQILEMLREADQALSVGAQRAALMIAWAGMEATLRRVAIQAGRKGEIGVQPVVLIRELVSAGIILPKDALKLENIRQIRTASAHGLAPEDINPEIIVQIQDLARQMLAHSTSNIRKQREVADIVAVDATDAYSIFVREKFCESLFKFFTDKGLRGRIEENAIGGDDPHNEIQVDKTIDFKNFVCLLNEWKESYINT
jgi:hypothetical protein